MAALLADSHVSHRGVLDQDLMQVVLVGEQPDRGQVAQEHLRAVEARPGTADVVVTAQPTSFSSGRYAGDRSWPASRTGGCPASRSRRTPAA